MPIYDHIPISHQNGERCTCFAFIYKAMSYLSIIGLWAIISIELISPSGESGGNFMKQWNYLAIEGLVFTCFLLVFTSISWYTKKNLSYSFLWPALKWGIIILTGIECLWGMAQLYHVLPSFNSRFTLTGSFPNPAPFSAYLILGLPICLNEYILTKKENSNTFLHRTKRLILIGLLVAIIIVLPSTMSRTAWIAAIISVLFVLEMHYHCISKAKKLFPQNKIKGVGYALGVGLLVFGLTFGAYSIKKESANGRLFLWKIEWNTIWENPLGYGAGKFPYAYKMSQEKYFAQKPRTLTEERYADSLKYAFNDYFQIAIEYGVFCSVLFVVFSFYCIRIGIEKKNYGTCGSILALMIFALASYPFQLPVFLITFFLLLFSAIDSKKLFIWANVLFFIFIYIYKYNPKKCDAYDYWRKNELAWNAPFVAIKECEKLYSQLKSIDRFLFCYGYYLYEDKRYEEAIEILKEAELLNCEPMTLNIIGKCYQELGQYAEAEHWYVRSTHLSPHRIYPYYLLARLYALPEFYKPEQFDKMKNIVLFKPPKVESEAIDEMRNNLKDIHINPQYN